MDDLTVFVRVKGDEIELDLYPLDHGDGIMTVQLGMPIETEFTIDSVSETASRVEALLKRS